MGADHGRLRRRRKAAHGGSPTAAAESRGLGDRDLRYARLWDRWFPVVFVVFLVVLGVAFVLALFHPGTIDGPLF